MPAEIVLFVLGGLTLVGVLVMDALGALGVFGALRFTSCPQCDRWTVHSLKATRPLVCHRCRRNDRGPVSIGAHRARWLHFGD
jgi:hypothetical protein